MTSADEIWNRAAMYGGGPAPSTGDVALAAALSLHSLTMSGGLVDAVERLGPAELDAAESGYRWLGLDAAAQVVAVVRTEIGDGALVMTNVQSRSSYVRTRSTRERYPVTRC